VPLSRDSISVKFPHHHRQFILRSVSVAANWHVTATNMFNQKTGSWIRVKGVWIFLSSASVSRDYSLGWFIEGKREEDSTVNNEAIVKGAVQHSGEQNQKRRNPREWEGKYSSDNWPDKLERLIHQLKKRSKLHFRDGQLDLKH